MIIKAEKDHYETLLSENTKNLRNTWQILKQIINKRRSENLCSTFRINNSLTSNKQLISNGFNSFFVNVGPSLANKIPSNMKSPSEYLTKRNINSILLSPVMEHEVASIIKSLKNSSPGWDAIAAVVLKATYTTFILPLTYILNL